MNNTEKEVELVKQSVINFIERNKMLLSPEQENSFLNIGTSILCEKWEVGCAGYSGSFVTSFADNDLRSAVAYADHINIGLLREYMLLWHNAVYPTELINADLLKYENHNIQK